MVHNEHIYIVLSHISCSPQLQTIRRKGSKVGYFWTIDPSGTCAKEVCSRLSQRQHGVGCQVKPCGCDCPSQLRKIQFSNFQTLKTIENLANFIYPAIKRYKELWRVEDRARSGRLISVRAEAAIKTGNRRSCPESWTYLPNQVVPHQGRSTHDSAPPLKETLPYSYSERNPTDKSKRSPTVARRELARKESSSGTRRFSPSRSSIATSTIRFMLKRPLRCVLRVQEANTLPTSWFGGGFPIRGWHLFIFERKVWKLVPECIKRMCYKELWDLLTRLFNDQKWVFQQNSALAHKTKTTQEWLRGMLRPLSAPRIGPRGVQTSTPWTINCGLFWRTRLAKSATTTWTAWRDPPGDGACRDSRVAGASEGLRRGTGRPFWVALL